MTGPAPDPPALLVARRERERDPALALRGYRKVLVTDLYPGEEPAREVRWSAGTPCPVLIDRNCELAIFNERARQDRHYHPRGTETYLVLEGRMTIEVAGQEYVLEAGDLITIPPGSVHEVKPLETFTAVAVTTKTEGLAEKITVAG